MDAGQTGGGLLSRTVAAGAAGTAACLAEAFHGDREVRVKGGS